MPQGARGDGMKAAAKVAMPPIAKRSPPIDKKRAAKSVASGRSVASDYDVAKIRKEFPILNEKVHGKRLVYLDNAATTQKPRSVIDAVSHYYEHDNSNIHRGVHLLSERAT